MRAPVILDVIEVDAVRRDVPLELRPTGATLAAMLELACSAVRRVDVRGRAEAWFGDNGVWRDMVDWLRHGSRPAAQESFGAPLAEVWGLETEDDVSGTEWGLFQARFRRSLTASGFSGSLALAISEAFWEMADNVYQHSGTRGLAGFHVGDGWASWAVGDAGCGVLESLRTNPAWAHLTSSAAALLAVWRDSATRRVDFETGDGFRQVERSIASLNGRLRFRTGDSVLTLDGTRGRLESSSRASPALVGLQISATCFTVARPNRPAIKY